ncbi:MAG: NHLP leader peptide family RiPP precursor [Calothrix sp. MO_167.B12]|nr:NHLP leader peptide family RiPP precursor [Calothrix sp. MO_167.B12]
MYKNTKLFALFQRSWSDKEFQQSLLNNPKIVLEQEMGITTPERVEIKAVAETEFKRYIVLPINGNSDLTPQTEESEFLAHLREKAATDDTFKSELINNPKAIIEKELGESIPDEVEVQILVEDENVRYFVLPVPPTLEDVFEMAWTDEVFKQQLLEDPKTTLENIGISTPKCELKAVEETDFNRYILLPPPEESNFTPEEAEADPLVALKAKAVKDEAFKQEFLNRPKETIKKELGIGLPSWVDVTVLEETAKKSFLIVPYMPSEEEISEEEMVAVSGGWRRFRFRGRRIRFSFRRGISYGRRWSIGRDGFRYRSRRFSFGYRPW